MAIGTHGKVAVIGLGIMGGAFARHLAEAGFEVSGYDPSDDARKDLSQIGGTAAGSPSAAVEGADRVLLSLPSVEALDTAVAGIAPALAAGCIVAEMSTLPPDAKSRAAAAVEKAGGTMLDCPVSGTGAQAASRDIVVFASGGGEAVESMRAVFSAIAPDVRHVGAFGAGMKMKYVANLLVAVHNLAAAEALLLAERSGLDLQMTFDAITAGAGNSRMLEVRGPLMIAGRHVPATMKLDLFMKDVMLIIDHAQETGTPVPLMSATLPFYNAALAQGRGKQDTAALFEVLRQFSDNAC